MSDTSKTDTEPSDGNGSKGDPPAVDPAEVAHVAELARVRLDESEIEQFAAEFAAILESFEALDDVPEVEREEALINVLRPDDVVAGLSQEVALANAAETEGGFFIGPKVS